MATLHVTMADGTKHAFKVGDDFDVIRVVSEHGNQLVAEGQVIEWSEVADWWVDAAKRAREKRAKDDGVEAPPSSMGEAVEENDKVSDRVDTTSYPSATTPLSAPDAEGNPKVPESRRKDDQ